MIRILLLTSLLLLCRIAPAIAQFTEISYDAGYTQQVFYQLRTGAQTTAANTSWDIAFTTQGLQDAGIFLNEAAGAEGVELELYLVAEKTYEENLTEDDLENRLYNDEQNWQYGAFNTMRASENPVDYGWGIYNPSSRTVEGQEVFVIKLRDGSFRKLEITSLSGTKYNVRHAALDGSNEVTFSLDKGDYPATDLVFYSLTDNQVVTEIPGTDTWDLLFTRYSTPLDDGAGDTLNYLLTGTLSGFGVEVAQADGVDPATVAYEAYADSLRSALDVIGYDWKTFDLQTFTWSLPQDRAYFVKTVEGRVWKLFFLDFEGSSTGVAVFEKTDLGLVTSVAAPSIVEDFTVFPNPVHSVATVGITLEQATRARLELFDAQGRRLWSTQASWPAGFQVQELAVGHLPPGNYYLRMHPQGSHPVTIPLIIAGS